MSVFLDTSGLYAVTDATDRSHARSRDALDRLLAGDDVLVTSNYVLVELTALLANRLGWKAVHWLHERIVPVVEVHWVVPSLHARGLAAYLATQRRRLSLVDCVSFEIMRELRLDTAFSVDKHFREQGFRCVP